MTVKTMRYAPAHIPQLKLQEIAAPARELPLDEESPLDNEELFQEIQRNMGRFEELQRGMHDYSAAYHQYQEGHVAVARRTLEELVAQRRANRDTHFLLALCYLREGNADAALGVLDQLAEGLRASVRRVPQSAILPLQLGKAELLRSTALYLSGEDAAGWAVLQDAVESLENAQQQGRRFGPAQDFPQSFASPLAAARTLLAEPHQSIDWMAVELIPY